jgi:hypothetical protein
MPNPLVNYRASLKDWPTWLPQQMPAPYSEIPEYPGFFLGPPKVGETLRQLTAEQFTQSALFQVWTMVPDFVRDRLIQAVAGVAQDVAEAGKTFADMSSLSVQGLGAGVATVITVVNASIDFANQIAGSIHKTLETNDQNRRDERLKFLEDLEDFGPSGWAISPWGMRTYEREIKLKKNQYPSIWPPDYTSGYGMVGPLLLSGAPKREGDCSRGDADFSGGLDSSCRGYMRVFPLFFPVWCTASLGSYYKSTRGMERSNDAGAAVWAKMLMLQAAMVGNPVANLQMDGRLVQKTWERLQLFFWGRYFNPPQGMLNHAGKAKGLRNISLDTDTKVFEVASSFDPNFPANADEGFFFITPKGRIGGFYLTPGGQIGAYNPDGTGSTDHPDLDAVGVYRWDSANTYGDYGNWITAANYNTVRAATGQFFALRMATLRRQPLTQAIVEQFPQLLEKQEYPTAEGEGTQMRYPIGEKKVREAIRASAKGATDPVKVKLGTVKAIPGGGGGPGIKKADVIPPKRASKEDKYATAKKIAAGAAVAGAGYAAWKYYKGRRR